STINRVIPRDFRMSNATNLIHGFEEGFFARDIESLVNSSDIILFGYYGEFLENFRFYGYDRNRDEIERRLGTTEESVILAMSIPVSDYSIVVDEVLMGEELIPDELILRIFEPEDNREMASVIEHREGRHLFFLTINPDRETVGLHGPMFDMKETSSSFTMLYQGQQTPVLSA